MFLLKSLATLNEIKTTVWDWPAKVYTEKDRLCGVAESIPTQPHMETVVVVQVGIPPLSERP